jgi:NAD(P)H-flavin reductase
MLRCTDYLHFTKRFGIVAVSQLPVQYLMALKYMNPFAWLFQSSHEQINKWHRVLGRIIFTMLCLHMVFYLNFFVGMGLFKEKMTSPVVLAGVVAMFLLNMLNTTAMLATRRASYITFFLVHLVVAFALPPLLFFHARPARLYLAEAFVVFVVDLVTRKLYTITTQASLEAIPGTNLIKISAPLPVARANRFREHPGAHVYLNIPDHEPLAFNPFTVAAIADDTGDITLVARSRAGPMSAALTNFAARPAPLPRRPTEESSKEEEEGRLPLNVEGPYGAATRFPALGSADAFDRVLLVAGGVGATFVVPVYRALLTDNPAAKVELVWAVRGAGDATWAVAGDEPGKGILSDKNVHIFLTGDVMDGAGTPGRNTRAASRREAEAAGAGVEMGAMYRGRNAAQRNRRRPDLKKIVDDTFRLGGEERVAVLVCGPEEMARDLRQHVGYWVMRGRSVWWHNETFGW